jgi:hypothetical protein
MSEDVLKANAIRRLSSHFDIREEVSGRHAFYDMNVRIDLMLKAKQPLVVKGFTSDWFGVECKWVSGLNGQTAKTTKVIWQSITYAQSVFKIDGADIVPRFIAVLTPDLEPLIERHIATLFQLALYGCVAKLYFYKDGHWGIKFASIYARSNDDGYQVSERQLPQYRAGSIT